MEPRNEPLQPTLEQEPTPREALPEGPAYERLRERAGYDQADPLPDPPPPGPQP